MQLRFLAAKVAAAMALYAGGFSMPAQAGIPVIDGSNLAQNILTAVEMVSQSMKQIQQYQAQLQQYENMLQNSLAPAAYIWDKAQSTINSLVQATDTLNHYKNSLGSIDAYLEKFRDVAYYRSSPCFSSGGCSKAEQDAMKQHEAFASESQKKANDALLRGIDAQQKNLGKDAEQLVQLQTGAQGASGQLEAIGHANQLASEQAHQLLQIRSLLIAQQNAMATRMQATADREAREQAASAHLRESRYKPSQERFW